MVEEGGSEEEREGGGIVSARGLRALVHVNVTPFCLVTATHSLPIPGPRGLKPREKI